MLLGKRGGTEDELMDYPYIFDAIPKNERWAAKRYGKDWHDYVNRTKSFIPYMY